MPSFVFLRFPVFADQNNWLRCISFLVALIGGSGRYEGVVYATNPVTKTFGPICPRNWSRKHVRDSLINLRKGIWFKKNLGRQVFWSGIEDKKVDKNTLGHLGKQKLKTRRSTKMVLVILVKWPEMPKRSIMSKYLCQSLLHFSLRFYHSKCPGQFLLTLLANNSFDLNVQVKFFQPSWV